MKTDGTQRPRSKVERVLDTAEALVDAADMAMRAHGPLGRALVALKLTQTGIRIWNTWRPRHHQTVDPTRYFSVEPGWTPVVYGEGMAALDGIRLPGKSIDTWTSYGDDGRPISTVFVASIEGGDVGWVSGNASTIDGCTGNVYVRGEGMPQRIREMARARMWREAGGGRVLQVTDDGTGVPLEAPTNIVSTAGIRDTAARVRRFWERGVFRAYLLNGEPGTGKTTAALHIAHDLGASIVVMDAASLLFGPKPSYANQTQWRPNFASLFTLSILGPDILVLNDVDRLLPDAQLQLLGMLERARKFARAVFLTTNDHREIVEAIRRPGRVDDVVSIKGLTAEEVAVIAGDIVPADLLPEMLGWPIAYVLDVRSRAQVLGGEVVRAEIHEVSARLADVRRALEDRDDRRPREE